MSNSRRHRFEPARVSWKKLNKYANINHHKTLDWSDSIEFIRRYYEKTPVKLRDPRAGEALDEIEAAPPSCRSFIEYLATLYRAGFMGSECAQDLQAQAIRRITHAHRFGDRTLRSAAAWAVSHGYAVASWIPIGVRVTTAAGDWKTKRIRRYSVTYKIRFLVSIIRNANNKNIHSPTPENFSDNPNGELTLGDSLDYSPRVKLLRHDQKDDRQDLPRDGRSKENEVSAKADSSTRAPRAPLARSEPLGHKTSTNAAPPRKKPSSKGFAFSDKARLETPRSYRAARNQLLHDLFVYLKPGGLQSSPDAQVFYNIAALQTDPFYPRFLPAVFDWYDLILTLYSQTWQDRRKTISKLIAPALAEYAAAWTPPELAEKDPNYFTKLDLWQLLLCPDPGLFVSPGQLPAYYAAWPHVRAYLSGVHSGVFNFDLNQLRRLSFCDFFTPQRI